MNPCARGCCWNPWNSCSRQRTCPCHWEERRPAPQGSDSRKFRDPTADTAIRNIMKGRPK